MATTAVVSPFPIITDTDGSPLHNGYVHIGVAGSNPINNPIIAYWDQALTIIAQQPLRTMNGYISRNGSPSRVYVNANDYSILVNNVAGVFLHVSLANSNIAAAIASSAITGQFDADRIDFTQAGTGAVLRTVESKLYDVISVKDFGAIGNGVNDDTAEIQAAIDSISKGTVFFPAGTYKITATLHMNTTNVLLIGAGNQASIIKGAVGFTGDEILHMVNPSGCAVQDLQLDANGIVDSGIHISDGTAISISRLLVKNCVGSAYKIRNVDNCVLRECGSDSSDNYAFDFLASAALDAVSDTDGIRCKLVDCYASGAGTTGTIYSEQVDTSAISVLLQRFKEISNGGDISVASNNIMLDHELILDDCLFLDKVPAYAAALKGMVRTGAIAITATPNYVPIAQLRSCFGGTTEYAGSLIVVVRMGVPSAEGSNASTAIYHILLNSAGTSSVVYSYNQPMASSLFKINTTTDQLEMATSAGTATYYFLITANGGNISVSNI